MEETSQEELIKHPGGRPSLYTQELADFICEQLALGQSMRTVCAPDEMPSMSSVFKWLRENKEFSQQYARAKEESTDAMSEELLDIADDGTNDWMTVKIGGQEKRVVDNEALQRSRLRVDTRKWLMSKMKPKKYGDKVDVTTNGKDLPTPLAVLNRDIPGNNSVPENSSAQ